MPYVGLPEDAVVYSGLPEGATIIETPPASTQPSGPPGFISRANQALVKRGVNISEELNQPSQGLEGDIRTAPEKALRVAGQSAGLIGDVTGEALKGAYNTIMPEAGKKGVRKGLEWLFKTEPGAAAARLVKTGGEAYGKFEQEYPNAGKDINALANILSVIPIQRAGKEGIDIGKDVATLATKKTAPQIESQIGNVVTRGIEKGIRPGVEGKSTFQTMTGYGDKAENAVRNIISNADNLNLTNEYGEVVKGLPKNLKQFSQAIDQTKSQIFEKYDTLAKQAGQQNTTVDLFPIAKELDGIVGNKVIQDLAPNTASYAAERAQALAQRRMYSPKEAQNAIATLNNTLEAFYKNPSYETATKAYVDSVIVNNLRKSLDDVIEKSVGSGYQELKHSYGALKAIEKDVNRRAIVDARKNTKGILDFADVFSGSTAAHGILSLNPELIGTAAMAKWISNLYKRFNDPNRIVQKMFEKTSKLEDTLTSSKEAFIPESASGKALQSLLFKGKNVPAVISPNFQMKGRPYSKGEPNFTVSDARNIQPRELPGIPNRPQIGYEPNFIPVEQPQLPSPQKGLPAPSWEVRPGGQTITNEDIQNILRSKTIGNLTPVNRIQPSEIDALKQLLGM